MGVARFPSQSGGNLTEGGKNTRFPSQSGGNLKEGGNRCRPPPAGSPCKQGEPNMGVARFPSQSGGNLTEGGKNTPVINHPALAWF
jgi:hypothetical protein